MKIILLSWGKYLKKIRTSFIKNPCSMFLFWFLKWKKCVFSKNSFNTACFLGLSERDLIEEIEIISKKCLSLLKSRSCIKCLWMPALCRWCSLDLGNLDPVLWGLYWPHHKYFRVIKSFMRQSLKLHKNGIQLIEKAKRESCWCWLSEKSVNDNVNVSAACLVIPELGTKIY